MLSSSPPSDYLGRPSFSSTASSSEHHSTSSLPLPPPQPSPHQLYDPPGFSPSIQSASGSSTGHGDDDGAGRGLGLGVIPEVGGYERPRRMEEEIVPTEFDEGILRGLCDLDVSSGKSWRTGSELTSCSRSVGCRCCLIG